MTHAAISLLFCLFVAATHGNSEALFLPAIWYMGREFAQAEYRYIAAYCGGKRANMPWYAPFTADAWTAKGLIDWMLPSLVCLGMWALNFFVGRAT